MQLDTAEEFETLYPDPQVLRKDLADLQKTLSERKEHSRWACRLRFISASMHGDTSNSNAHEDQSSYIQQPADVEGEGTSNTSDDDSDETECSCSGLRSAGWEWSDTISITTADEHPDCVHYVAVSWCWSAADDTSHRESYQVTEDTTTRACTVPGNILPRAVSYAKAFNVPFIWIDKECIQQDDCEDKELGIQSMDIVYQRASYPLGLLQVYFDQQYQLDILEALFEGGKLDAEQMPSLLQVVNKIAEDPWFQRAWILQESVSAGLDMVLMMRHEPTLSKSVYFGKISGEVQIVIFYLLMVMLYAIGYVELLRVLNEIVGCMPPYVAEEANSEGVPGDAEYRQTCSAAQALTYLHARKNSQVVDRVAILANLRNYSLRLDTNTMEPLGLGFSVGYCQVTAFGRPAG